MKETRANALKRLGANLRVCTCGKTFAANLARTERGTAVASGSRAIFLEWTEDSKPRWSYSYCSLECQELDEEEG